MNSLLLSHVDTVETKPVWTISKNQDLWNSGRKELHIQKQVRKESILFDAKFETEHNEMVCLHDQNE